MTQFYTIQKYLKKIKAFIRLVKIYTNRLFKKAHPYALRKEFKYVIARAGGGYIDISKPIKEYIDSLIRSSESAETNFIIRSSQKGDRSYLSVPLTQARFLEAFMRSIKATHVLEIGTFKGFSTAFIARGLQEGGLLFSCDEDSRPIPAARRFWQALDVEKNIHFELGEAKKVLEKLTSDTPSLEFFDAIFIDADKENYKLYVTESLRLLKPGGTMLIDNTLWKGLVQYENSHDNGAIHMRAFNTWIFSEFGNTPGFITSFIPAWDGLIMIVKK